LVDHDISKEEIEAQFAISRAFFDLPAEVKAKTPHDNISNNGWEYKVGKKVSVIPKSLSDSLGSTAPQHRHIRPKGITLAATQVALAN
jgi:isopenicillin N synthase-like dioxygenase